MNLLRGPRPMTPYDAQFLRDRLRGKAYLPLAYFEGATPENGYRPQAPYTLNVLADPRPQDIEPGYLRVFLKTADDWWERTDGPDFQFVRFPNEFFLYALTEDGLLEQALHVKFSDIEQDEGYLPWQNRDFAWQDGRLAIVCNSRSDIQDGEQYPSRHHYGLGCGLSVSVYADDALQYYGIYDSTLDLANGYAADVQPPYQNPISAVWHFNIIHQTVLYPRIADLTFFQRQNCRFVLIFGNRERDRDRREMCADPVFQRCFKHVFHLASRFSAYP